MALRDIQDRGLVLLGCGRMGTAMLEGWLARGIPPASFTILDPNPSERLRELEGEGLRLNAALPESPAIVVLAVKPQVMKEALPDVRGLGGGATLFLSIAAGTGIATLEETIGGGTPVIRAMPNTPAAIGRGITALVGNAHVSAEAMDTADELLQAVGQTVRLDGESQMDAVTAVSGSGPAYVFLMIEALAKAGEAEGLDAALALALARATVAGAGALADSSGIAPDRLRVNVTSPGGTTAAALETLMREPDGLPALVGEAVRKAAARSRELAR